MWVPICVTALDCLKRLVGNGSDSDLKLLIKGRASTTSREFWAIDLKLHTNVIL